MPDTNDQTIANPQSLVDAALGSAPMGDETPLAFVAPEPAALPPVEAVVPPVLPLVVPPAPVGLPKKKSKIGIVIGGVLLLVLALGGGVWGYQQYIGNQEALLIAPVTGCNACNTKHPDYDEEACEACALAKKVVKDNKNIRDPIKKEAEIRQQVERQIKNDEKAIDLNKKDNLKLTTAECSNLRENNWEKNKSGIGTALCADGSCNNGGMAKCRVEKVRCDVGGQVGVACNQEKVPGNKLTEGLTCGSEQIDVICDGCGNQPVAFTNQLTGKTCASTKPKEPNEPTGSTMACTGLTSVPALTPAPVLGTKLTFTCAGSVTPPITSAISYKFRYSINNGAYVVMTNKTPTTVELTVAACGTYSVQCQACATLDGVLKCAPVWTGATQ